MLQLNTEQVAALQTIKHQRDLLALGDSLAAAFPEARGRLGDQHAALVEQGVARAASHGLTHAVCVARYLACWFMLGAEFETRPGYEWARDLLAASARTQGGKVFQLCRRSREALAEHASPALTPAGFDQSIALLDAALLQRGTMGSLLPTAPLQLGDACDIDALDLRLIDAEAGGASPLTYQLQDKQWRRLPGSTARPPMTVSATQQPGQTGQASQTLPTRLHFLSQPAEHSGHSRLRLRTRAARCCDTQVHPLVSLNGPQGLNQWRGPLSADITLNLYADSPSPALDDALQLTIALENTPRINVLSLSSCGLRDSGQPLGEQQTQLATYPSEQHLMAWHRELGPALAWPEPAAGQPSATLARLRIERDGLPLESSRWQAGLQDLDRQLAESLARLATAWERESGVRQGRLSAEPAVMSGHASITWGWAEAPEGQTVAPYYRLAGALDLVACQLHLRLDGELALHGSLSRVSLHCSGRQTLQLQFERKGKDADLLAVIKPAQTSFRHPFVLQLESLVQSDQPTLLNATGLVAGALVGSCGLRPRAEGPGLQWFCSLAIEPVSTVLLLHDPLLGQRNLVRPLLPALQLLDWSMG